MRDGFSLDQIRAFLAAVEEGSFSAAARRLRCAQSAVSEMIRRLEEECGIQLFDRATRSPTLTNAGQRLLADAKTIAEAANRFTSSSQGLAMGLESELCIVVDHYFPAHILTEASVDFRAEFPDIPLRLYVEALGGAMAPVLHGQASFAIVSEQALGPSSIITERLTKVELVAVAAPIHSLCAYNSLLPCEELVKHVQLVVTERNKGATARDHNVLSPSTWRLSHLSIKRSLLLSGLGWGFMPRHAVDIDLAEGKLKTLRIEDQAPVDLSISMFVAYRGVTPPGRAGRWMIDRLQFLMAEIEKTSDLDND